MRAWIVFAKEPGPGAVKTRMVPPLSGEQAARLCTAFVEDVCAAIASTAAPGDRRILAAPEGGGPVLAGIAARSGFSLGTQVGPDLGTRMRRALQDALGEGATAAVLVGSDIPTLPVDLLARAMRTLDEGPDGMPPGVAGDRPRAVIGPAGDGGYWLVGTGGGVPDLFDDVPWSTRDVLAATLARAARVGQPVDLLPFWYDVDDVHDLRLLDRHLCWMAAAGIERAPRTRAAVEALKASNPAFFLA